MKILRNILAVIAGLIVGSVVNMGIIMISSSIVPPPDGADLSTTEGLIEAMPLMTPIHFLMPFLAHALGTFVGAIIAAAIGVNRKLLLAMIIGVFFLIGGIASVFMLPSPMWFNAVDLVFAYIPMAWLGAKVVMRK